MNKFSGSCHCQKVQFEVETDLSGPVRCNCTFCVKRGAILQRVSGEAFTLLTGEDDLTQYGSRSFSDHFFCKHCGVFPFTRSTRRGYDEVVVNLTCLQGVDTASMQPRLFDGANLL